MDENANERVATAWEYRVRANSAGTPRSMISEGYLAIDNFLSAIIIEVHGQLTTRTHPAKIDQVEEVLPNLFEDRTVSFADIRQYHQLWNEVRYSRQPVDVESAIEFRRIVGQVSHAAIEFFAHREHTEPQQLEDQFYSMILGQRWTEVDEAVEAVHEKWQTELEILGETGHGSKLGNKILNPSNFSALDVLTADGETREIINEDPALAREIADLYNTFLGLIVQLTEKRLEEGVAPEEITRFDVSIRLQYIAQDLETIMGEFGDRIRDAIVGDGLNSSEE